MYVRLKGPPPRAAVVTLALLDFVTEAPLLTDKLLDGLSRIPSVSASELVTV